jgi:hypothetical protein
VLKITSRTESSDSQVTTKIKYKDIIYVLKSTRKNVANLLLATLQFRAWKYILFLHDYIRNSTLSVEEICSLLFRELHIITFCDNVSFTTPWKHAPLTR